MSNHPFTASRNQLDSDSACSVANWARAGVQRSEASRKERRAANTHCVVMLTWVFQRSRCKTLPPAPSLLGANHLVERTVTGMTNPIFRGIADTCEPSRGRAVSAMVADGGVANDVTEPRKTTLGTCCLLAEQGLSSERARAQWPFRSLSKVGLGLSKGQKRLHCAAGPPTLSDPDPVPGDPRNRTG